MNSSFIDISIDRKKNGDRTGGITYELSKNLIKIIYKAKDNNSIPKNHLKPCELQMNLKNRSI